jgi:hypothetical protein
MHKSAWANSAGGKRLVILRRARVQPALTRRRALLDMHASRTATRRPVNVVAVNSARETPRTCPVCRLAMQAQRIENSVQHACEGCGLTITFPQQPLSPKTATLVRLAATMGYISGRQHTHKRAVINRNEPTARSFRASPTTQRGNLGAGLGIAPPIEHPGDYDMSSESCGLWNLCSRPLVLRQRFVLGRKRAQDERRRRANTLIMDEQ